MNIFDDPNFDEIFQNAIYNSREDEVDVEVSDDWDDDPFGIDDGQPTHQQEVEALEEEDYCGID